VSYDLSEVLSMLAALSIPRADTSCLGWFGWL